MRALNKSVLVLLLAPFSGCGQPLVQFPGSSAPLVPAVTSTDPASGATDIGLSRTVNATFNIAMAPATITTATFTLMQGSMPVQGAVRYAGLTATFEPALDLPSNTTFTASITTGASSAAAGIGLADTVTWSFTTVFVAPIPPSVISTVPGAGSIGLPTDQPVSVDFSTAMNPATLNSTTFTVSRAATAVAGQVTYAGVTARFIPSDPFLMSTTYTATITDGARDSDGVGLASAFSWTFTTGSLTSPSVTSTTPGNGATGVPTMQQVGVTFSTPMDTSSIDGTTFTLSAGTTMIAGTVMSAGASAATLVPLHPLAYSTSYVATITTGAEDMAGAGLAADYTWTFVTGPPAENAPPLVIATDPGAGSTGVPVNQLITATFSTAMDPTTINTTTFSLTEGTMSITGAVTSAGVTAAFAPASPLAMNTTYTATITSGAQDVTGVKLVAADIWTFTTAALPSPTVTSTNPGNGSTGVPLDQQISATFSTAMEATTINAMTFTVHDGTTGIAGSILASSATTFTFTPTNPLTTNTTYTALLTTGAQDLTGVGLAANDSWTFTTGAPIDGVPPQITETSPLDLAMNACPDLPVTATFNKPMDVMTIDGANFTLTSPPVPPSLTPVSVAGSVTYNAAAEEAVFTPAANLPLNTTFTATVTTGVKSETGVPMAFNDTWTFTTAMAACANPVNLRSLSTFVAVAGAGLTNSNSAGVTVLGGNVGLSPSITCLSDGSPCNPAANAPKITGTLYADDPAGIAAAAKADLVQAYNDASTRPPGVVEADLSGLILAPGVYTSASTMLIAVNGVLTLDAQGNADAVWIFQVGSALTVNTGAKVLLVNGASAGNVFWAVGSSSTLGGGVSFAGDILAQSSNSVGTGSTVLGRLLCTTGQITLLSNTITLPSP